MNLVTTAGSAASTGRGPGLLKAYPGCASEANLLLEPRKLELLCGFCSSLTDQKANLDKYELKMTQDIVPQALTCLRCFSSILPQNRHPERSALPICRVTQRLWRGVEGPRRCF